MKTKRKVTKSKAAIGVRKVIPNVRDGNVALRKAQRAVERLFKDARAAGDWSAAELFHEMKLKLAYHLSRHTFINIGRPLSKAKRGR